jgi:uncharacterized protein (TIGR00730 family)
MPEARRLRSVCVYLGSSPGEGAAFMATAAAFGRLLARRGCRLVYGGGRVGCMGALADAALEEGGEVSGVITRALKAKEIAHLGLTELRVVETMHERKAVMSDLADAFVMLPGGFGTWDEFMEALTWSQLGIHHKPCGVLEVGDYFAPLRAWLATATRQRFVRPEHAGLVLMDRDPAALLDRLAVWEGGGLEKWLDRSQR